MAVVLRIRCKNNVCVGTLTVNVTMLGWGCVTAVSKQFFLPIFSNYRRGTPENSWWGVPLVSPNPEPISDQKMSFFVIFLPYPFSDLAFR